MVPLSTQKRKLQMTVQRNTEGVLVVQNSTLWLSAVFGVVGLVMIAATFSSGDKRLAGPALVMGLFAVLCLTARGRKLRFHER